jgi:hypothetical protein
MSMPLWINEPTILFHKDYILELWPFENLSHTQKINAITRMIIILAIIGLIVTNSYYIVVVALIALLVILFLSKTNEETFKNKKSNVETFINNTYVHPETKKVALKSDFERGTKQNPFGNVLLTDINDNPEKKPAPPSFIKEVGQDIKHNIEEMILENNPHMKDKEVSLWDEFQGDRANHTFYSTANTRVDNDQGAYADFLYGNMPSSKESNVNGALMRTKNNSRYTLY